MAIKAIKFGGSSLADAGQFQKVKEIVTADKDRRFVVPSAPGRRYGADSKVTDMLYECDRLASKGVPFDDVFDRICSRYTSIETDLKLCTHISDELATVKKNIQNGAGADYAASRGEYLNGILLADYLGFAFADPADFICFDEKGRFLPEKTNEKASATLRKLERAVVPGFYGAYPNGNIKTFSRGGSDITGAIVARGVDADVYENWTDVSGFLMADPRIVRNPMPIRVVTYSELRELAYMGATVLHEESIFPVRQACIPINVRNTNEPDEIGTMIVAEADDYTDCAVTGIAGKKGFTVINIEKDKMNTEVGFAYRMLGVLAKHGVSIEHMPTGIDTLSVIVSSKDMEADVRGTIIDEIMAVCEPDAIEVHDDIALIAVVGRGMINRVGTSARIFTALAANGVNVRMIDQGSSEINIIIGVETSQFDTAVNAIYYSFMY